MATPTTEALLRERKWLRRLTASLVVDAAQADDLTQQALLAALERPPRDASRPRPWLTVVVRNLARRFGASEQRRSERERAVAADERLPPTDELVAEAARQHEISAALLELDEPYRSTLLLRFFKDLPPRTIAKRLGLPVETVRTRVNRGIDQLRARVIAGRGPIVREQAVGLLALLDGTGRRAVERALLGRVSVGLGTGTGAVAGAAGAIGLSGVMGVVLMSTKLKLAAAALIVVVGTLAVAKLKQSPSLHPPNDPGQEVARASPVASPASVAPAPSPTTESVTRTLEAAAPDGASPPPTSASPPATCVIDGVVYTSRGELAGGAVVALEVVEHTQRFTSLKDVSSVAEELLGRADAEPIDERVVKVGFDGRFHFEGLAPHATVALAAIHRTEGIGLRAGLLLDAAHSPEQVDLVLVAGVVVHGTVTNGDGQPIAGASVALMLADESGMSYSLCYFATGADGAWRSLALPFDRFAIDVAARGFLDASRRHFVIANDERERREDFVLERASTLSGRIVATDGGPVNLGQASEELAIFGSGADPSATPQDRLDSQGRGVVLCADDRYELVEQRGAIGFVSLWSGKELLGSAKVERPGVGPDVVVDLLKIPRPAPTGSLRLAVVDAASGAPVASFVVRLTRGWFDNPPETPWPPAREERGATGRLIVERLGIGAHELEIEAPAYASRVIGARIEAGPDPVELRVELRPANASIGGQVVDETGAPFSGARLCLLGTDGGAALAWPHGSATSAPDGTFVFDPIADGDYFVVAEAEGLAPVVTSARGGDHELAITLRPGFSVKISARLGDRIFGDNCSMRLCDERGVPIVDELREGSIRSWGGFESEVVLAPGFYTLELFSRHHHGGPVRFQACVDLTVPVELVPIAEPTAGH